MRVKVGAIGEMAAEYRGLKRQGGHLVATLQVPGPMPYDIVVAVNHQELRQVVRSALQASVISFLLFGFRSSQDSQPSEPEDY
jgi:hypothetical protein